IRGVVPSATKVVRRKSEMKTGGGDGWPGRKKIGQENDEPRSIARAGFVSIEPAMTYSRAGRTTIGPKCLSAVFGMGTGVSTWAWSPALRAGGFRRLMSPARPVFEFDKVVDASRYFSSTPFKPGRGKGWCGQTFGC